tara:strand:- start:1808 stop:2035 length:228 start_codon:yes stop_codon:yes gene_type:complete
LKFLFQQLQAAKDINIYNVVQIGPNTQPGGLKLGNIICEYQGSLNAEVVNPPIPEAKKVTINIKIKDKYLFLVIK